MSGTQRFDIDKDIPAGKVVVLSLVGMDEAQASNFTLSLKNANTGELAFKSGPQGGKIKMTYFKTNDLTNTRYYAYINVNQSYIASYQINVSILDSISFTKCDTKGQASSGKTYLISNWPELLNLAEYKGDEGYCLQRSRVEGNANIYWEHWNLYNREMKFGVLLYNDNQNDVTVTLNRRVFTDNLLGATALNDIWKVWLDKIGDDDDDSGFSSTVTIPPNGSQWICLYTVPYRSWGVIFNGVVDISIQSGYNLLCHTYIMEPTADEQVKANVANAVTATCLRNGDKLRGSGPSAMLISNEGTKSITPGNPYRLAITGHNMPYINSGELIEISEDSGAPIANGCNYGVVYKLNFGGFSGGNIKGQVNYNTKLNPNYPGNIYVIVQKVVNGIADESKGFLLQTSGPTTETFDDNVPAGNVTYYIIVNSMSCMPLEVCFTNG